MSHSNFSQPLNAGIALLEKASLTATVYFEDFLFSIVKDIERVVTSQTESYTTLGRRFEVVRCTNTSAETITVHTPQRDGDIVILKRAGTGAISYICTAGIDSTVTALTLAAQYDSVYLISVDGEWSIIAS